MGLFEPDEQQQSWISIQRVVAATLTQRLVEWGETVTTAEEADMLADHVADDLAAQLRVHVPAQHRLP